MRAPTAEDYDDARREQADADLEECPKCKHRTLMVDRRRGGFPPYYAEVCLCDDCDYRGEGAM